MSDNFCTCINVTQIRLSTMYFDSIGGTTALFSNCAAAVSKTMQQPWRSLSSLSASSSYYYAPTVGKGQ